MKRNKKYAVNERKKRKEEKGKQRKDKYTTESSLAPPLIAKNEKQREFLKATNSKQVVLFNAPAGVGKSYLTMGVVTDWLKKGIYDKVILTRPSVGMGKTLGLLPGDLADKFTPYLLPLIDAIKGRYGEGFYNNSLSNGTIEFSPLEYIRGRSFSEVVVLDEAQNVTPSEMYTILTRIEEEGKLIIIGDPTQNDLRGENGIEWLNRFVNTNPELRQDIKIVTASSDDIVRSGLCKKMVKCKEKYDRYRT